MSQKGTSHCEQLQLEANSQNQMGEAENRHSSLHINVGSHIFPQHPLHRSVLHISSVSAGISPTTSTAAQTRNPISPCRSQRDKRQQQRHFAMPCSVSKRALCVTVGWKYFRGRTALQHLHSREEGWGCLGACFVSVQRTAGWKFGEASRSGERWCLVGQLCHGRAGS